jgi:hypothetical protein
MRKILPKNPKRRVLWSAMAIISLLLPYVAHAYVINNYWPDGDNIVIDDVLSPAATWSDPAQFQMTEWNEIDTTDKSHPFRINSNPQFSFGANDGDNTIGFLGESGLNSEYGLSYASALAWTVCWTGFFSGRYDECDIMFDPTLGWSLGPNDSTWFQSTVLHELGHVRGLGHYNSYLCIENSGTSKYLRGETLYMDDKVAVRQHASHVSERDIVMYNKWHDGSSPRWMSMSPTTLREGDTIQLHNITVENRGTLAFGSTLRFGIYLSTNSTISTGDQLLNTGSWGSFGTYTFNTFDWSARIPTVSDCGTRYIGGIIDDNGAWAERFEGNNAVTFTNGVPYTGSSFTPTALTILLAEDPYEQNDTRTTASVIIVPFYRSDLCIDSDSENDYYRFSLGADGNLDVGAFFSHSTGDIDLSLLNSAGSILASSSSTTNNESIFRHIDAGTYYVRVYGYGVGSCNRYSLDIGFTPDPGVLSVSPGSSLVSTGPQGGPFSPSSINYTLSNTGHTTINYSISKTKTWVSLSRTGGSLAPGGNVSATVSINSNANGLGAGSYSDAVLFTNTTNGNGNTSRSVSLTVTSPVDLCEGDINGDHLVNFVDLALLKGNFFTNCSTLPPGTECVGDINGDGQVNFADLALMKQDFFRTDCP